MVALHVTCFSRRIDIRHFASSQAQVFPRFQDAKSLMDTGNPFASGGEVPPRPPRATLVAMATLGRPWLRRRLQLRLAGAHLSFGHRELSLPGRCLVVAALAFHRRAKARCAAPRRKMSGAALGRRPEKTSSLDHRVEHSPSAELVSKREKLEPTALLEMPQLGRELGGLGEDPNTLAAKRRTGPQWRRSPSPEKPSPEKRLLERRPFRRGQ